jgi:hypothetical protein
LTNCTGSRLRLRPQWAGCDLQDSNRTCTMFLDYQYRSSTIEKKKVNDGC